MLPRIDRYEISEEIGHGGMATVYRARDSRLDRWVAVKVMHPHLRGTEEARARFSREARAVAKLKHPAILEIYDYSGNESADAYIATELLTGPTLRAFVDRHGEVPAEIAACIGVELAQGLSAAHAQGIVHRDVKPENVLIHESRAIKLTDFGIAHMLDPNASSMTATGQILGSPAHMAPEQVEGGDADARSDVFSVGTILYWASTGTLPFSGKNPHQVLKRVVDCNPVDPLLLKPSIGRDLRDIIMRCLAKDPAARYQRAEELSDDLTRLLRDMGIEDPRATLSAYLAQPAQQTEVLREHVLEQLTRRATEAVNARDRLRALPHLERMLALRDGHPEALRLLHELDRFARRRTLLRTSGAACAAALLVGLWVAFAPASGALPQVQREPRAKASQGTIDPRTRDPKPADQAEKRLPVAPPAADAQKPEAADDKPVRAADDKRPVRPVRPRETGPRTVVFDPEPANVTISVDGAPARPFGPSFRMIELPAGPHTFRFVGAHECCEEREVKLDVPGGPGETVVDPKLTFRPARLYVASDIPADVAIDEGFAKGRTRSFIQVPVELRLTERRRISVTAPGFEPYTGYVQLRAGQVSQIDVLLKPSAPR